MTRINTEHSVETSQVGIDEYYIKIDRGTSRGTDDNTNNIPQLSVAEEASGGGNSVYASKNIQYDAVRPLLQATTFGSTDFLSLQLRSVSGTSVDGGEASFVDAGFENIGLNRINQLESTRIIAARVNESNKLGSITRSKSHTITVELDNGGDDYNSPTVDLEGASSLFYENRLNAPITDYLTDPRAKQRFNDPHASYYMSNPIYIKNPATSLKVIFDSRRPPTTDFRVLHSTLRADSSEVTPGFELFPGFLNLVDIDGDGVGDQIIDPKNNSGLPDLFIPPDDTVYREYQYTVDNLPSFTGFQIKIVFTGTNQSKYPVIKNLRVIAVA